MIGGQLNAVQNLIELGWAEQSPYEDLEAVSLAIEKKERCAHSWPDSIVGGKRCDW